MERPPASNGGRRPSAGDARGWPGEHDRSAPLRADDGWGPSTAVYSESYAGQAGTSPRMPERRAPARERREAPSRSADDGWNQAGPASSRDQRAVKAADRRAQQRVQDSIDALQRRSTVDERGRTWWAALLVLIVIAVLGGIIDTLTSVQDGFNVAVVLGSVVAILLVRRSHMFPVVIAPPIVYSLGALFQLYVRSSGLSNRKVVLDAAANYLVYGFPAIATASAAVLIIAGIRMITRK